MLELKCHKCHKCSKLIPCTQLPNYDGWLCSDCKANSGDITITCTKCNETTTMTRLDYNELNMAVDGWICPKCIKDIVMTNPFRVAAVVNKLALVTLPDQSQLIDELKPNMVNGYCLKYICIPQDNIIGVMLLAVNDHRIEHIPAVKPNPVATHFFMLLCYNNPEELESNAKTITNIYPEQP